VKRRDHPRTAWIIEHLADLWLFGVVTPVLVYVLQQAL
jgi:hypothetical protein